MLAAIPTTILLAAACLALGGAAYRVASLIVPRGLARVVSVVVLAAAAAAAEALILGWIGLGMSPVALAVAAGLTWALALWRCPRPAVGLLEDGLGTWRELRPAERILLAGVAGAWLAWSIWAVARPALGLDMVSYHVPESLLWVQDGNPGAARRLLTGLPVEAYPGLDELIAAWAVALGRSLAPFSVLPMVWIALLAASIWLGLRALGVARLATGLVAGAVCFVPTVLGWQVNGAPNDVTALAALAAAAALCAASRERPLLVAPAIVATGLAIGCKPPAALIAVVVVIAALVVHRRALRPLAAPLAGAAALGGLVGLYWYVRNLLNHGSPLWPWIGLPGGDPADPGLSGSARFLDRPRVTIEALEDYWRDQFAGPILLFAGAAIAALLVPRRRVLIATAIVALGILSWAAAPASGIEILPQATFSSTRYLLPAITAAAIALAFVTAAGGWRAIVAYVLLTAALGINVAQTLELDPWAPSPLVPLAGLLAGAAAGALASLVSLPDRAWRPSPALGAALAVVAVALSGLALAAATSRYLQRHSVATDQLYADVIPQLVDRTSYGDDELPITSGPHLRTSLLAGDRLEHDVRLLPLDVTCSDVRAALRDGYLVSWIEPFDPGGRVVRRCLAGLRPVAVGHAFRVDSAR